MCVAAGARARAATALPRRVHSIPRPLYSLQLMMGFPLGYIYIEIGCSIGISNIANNTGWLTVFVLATLC